MKQTRQYMHGVTAWIVVIFAVVGLSSCLEEYLDRSPDSGLDENEVFSKFANFKSFFYSVYDGADKTDGTGVNIKPHYPLYHARWDQKMTMESLTDMCDMVRYQYAQPPKRGEGSELFAQQIGYYHNRAKVPQSWKAIRVCNMTIEHIDDVLDISAIDKNDFLGQAYFVRAFCHFELFRFYGSLPYIDKALGPNDEWDLPRMDAHDMLLRIAEDFETAATYLAAAGKTRRDPASGAGHLADPDQGKPNGATAKAFKARALLYAASPLNNPSNISAYWEEAAIACWDALSVALENGYSLLSKAEYTRNFYGTKYTNEHLWTDGSTTGTFSITNAASFETLIPSVFWSQANASGQCPTENFVTRFETDEGYPLYTDEERATAIAAGKYNAQNPYVHRDPRFDFIVIYNQKPLNGYGNASLYIEENGSRPAGSLMPLTPTDRYTRTGYYERKRTGDFAARSSVTSLAITDPIIRLAELYLNYAEAANEAYGPNGAAPGASLTALQALNRIRARVEMPDVLARFTTSKELLRPRVKNERIIELCFEGFHYYCDIRRWGDAPTIMSGTLYGIQAVRLATPDPVNYPTGFRYTRVPLDADRQVAWVDGMEYIPFIKSELAKMKNYVPNTAW